MKSQAFHGFGSRVIESTCEPWTLHLHGGEALDKLGDRARAAEQYRTAGELALSELDKEAVARHLASESH